jgi:esterase
MPVKDEPVALYNKQFGSGPSLVILHGLFGSWENWRSHARQLAEHFQVTLLDLRNHGQSEHRSVMNYPVMASDVAFTCQQLGIEQTHVVGHSMGGKTAMQLALDYPQLVKRLIVVDIGPGQYPPHHQKILEGMGLIAAQPVESRQAADAILSQYEPAQGIRSFLLKNLERTEDGQYRLRINLDAIIKQYNCIAAAITADNHDASDQPEATVAGNMPDTPTLFIKGGDSDYLKEKDREAILALFPAATVKVVAGTGHWLHSEKPALVQKIIHDFLNSE